MSAIDPQDSAVEEVCYRHPDRATGVSCQRCDRLICPKCMHQASVGVHCPECTRGSTQKVYTANTLPGAQAFVTKALIAINVFVFVAAIPLFDATLWSAGDLALEIAVNGEGIDRLSQPWRIITGGFGHFGLLHLGMNMYGLWWLGQLLERQLGPKLFLAAYLVSLIGGSLGALLLEPRALTMGASGAIFGLLGLTVVTLRSRGIGLQQSGLGRVLLLNLFISLSGFVSLGGHAGGFIAGLALGAVYFGVNPGDGPMLGGSAKKHMAVSVALGVALFAASLWAATTWISPLF
jgi:membrane associated rhomboid family serine protease